MDLVKVLALASLTALGNYIGGYLTERIEVTGRRLNLSLHAAGGILLAVVGVELIPRALGGAAPWKVVLAFLLGGLTAVALRAAVNALQRRRGEGGARGWMIYTAVVVDLTSDGLLIGAGSSISFQLAFLLALAQVTADIPEGFATMATFKRRGYSRRTRLLLSAGFLLPVLAAAAFSYLVLRQQAPQYQLLGLAFAAGLLVLAAAEDMMPEAHESAEDTWMSGLSFIGGFSLFMLLSASFG